MSIELSSFDLFWHSVYGIFRNNLRRQIVRRNFTKEVQVLCIESTIIDQILPSPSNHCLKYILREKLESTDQTIAFVNCTIESLSKIRWNSHGCWRCGEFGSIMNSEQEARRKKKGIWYIWTARNLPQLAPVRPRNCPVSEFHRKTLKPSHLPSFGGGV